MDYQHIIDLQKEVYRLHDVVKAQHEEALREFEEAEAAKKNLDPWETTGTNKFRYKIHNIGVDPCPPKINTMAGVPEITTSMDALLQYLMSHVDVPDKNDYETARSLNVEFLRLEDFEGLSNELICMGIVCNNMGKQKIPFSTKDMDSFTEFSEWFKSAIFS